MAIMVVSSQAPHHDFVASWPDLVKGLFFALQPIVNIHTGRLYAVEALLRGTREAGFSTISEFFDVAWTADVLKDVDLELRQKAFAAFEEAELLRKGKLFYNLDTRLLDTGDFGLERTFSAMRQGSIPISTLCFELSERHALGCYDDSALLLNTIRQRNFKIALDDFGSGYSGLQLLYHAGPDFVKIDRFFIDRIDDDPMKRLFVSKVVNMAHTMGILVVAEGIETKSEYYTCRDAGCDLAQGYFVCRPEKPAALARSYPRIEEALERERRQSHSSEALISRRMEYVQPIDVVDPIMTVLTRFRKDEGAHFFPVLNSEEEPVGIIREKDLKSYVYSPYGISLLMNQANRDRLNSFIYRAPLAEIHTRLDRIVSIYAQDQDAEAVLITENGKYRGVLTSKALIEILNEREITAARDQNPLTKLPGNIVINEYVTESLHILSRPRLLIYFDFDNFKPFNDTFGFRLGDRVILLFADLLRELQSRPGTFIGHIGGDDFFLGLDLDVHSIEDSTNTVDDLVAAFAEAVVAFYSPEDQERGHIIARGRNGRKRRYPLLTVTAAGLSIEGNRTRRSVEDVAEQIARLKEQAKAKGRSFLWEPLNVGAEDQPSDLPVGF